MPYFFSSFLLLSILPLFLSSFLLFLLSSFCLSLLPTYWLIAMSQSLTSEISKKHKTHCALTGLICFRHCKKKLSSVSQTLKLEEWEKEITGVWFALVIPYSCENKIKKKKKFLTHFYCKHIKENAKLHANNSWTD